MSCPANQILARAATNGFTSLPHRSIDMVMAELLCEWKDAMMAAPVAPTNLDVDVSAVTADPATFFTKLTWNSTIVPDSFEIWRDVNGGGYAPLTTVGGGVLTYSDDCRNPPMVGDDVFTYKVRSKVGAQTSTFTNEVQSAKGVTVQATAAVALSYPLLKLSFFDIVIDGNNNLLSVSFPVLKRVATEIFVTTNPICTSITFPALTSHGFAPVFDGLHLSANDSLPTLDLSALQDVHCNDGFEGGSCTNLTSITFGAAPVWVDDLTGPSISFDFCALNAATINRILAICVANGWSTGFIKLDAGTNSPPTGQGVIDKATLIGNGCTVVTN